MQDFRMDTFIEVCQCMNYTRAAERLSITQPAVSGHIRVLEKHYGVTLLAFEGKNMRLTKEGEVLYRAALRMRHDEKRLEEMMHDMEQGRENWKFGATLTIGQYVLPDRISQLVREHPNLNLRMEVANTRQLLTMLDEGELDFAFVEGYFEKKAYEYQLYSREKFVCVTGNAYELPPQAKYMRELFGETIITREAGSGTREILERFLQEENYSIGDFAKIIEMNNMTAIKTLLQDNCGIAFVYEAAVHEELLSGALKRIALKDFTLSHEFNFIYQKNSMFAKEYSSILQLFKK